MRKFITVLTLLAASSIAHAEPGQNQLFDCMDANTFELNNQCMADAISSNVRYREAQDEVVKVANENHGEYAIATMTFDARKMQIDIVAHRDALQTLNALAKVQQ